MMIWEVLEASNPLSVLTYRPNETSANVQTT
jgi:hypothetical protein